MMTKVSRAFLRPASFSTSARSSTWMTWLRRAMASPSVLKVMASLGPGDDVGVDHAAQGQHDVVVGDVERLVPRRAGVDDPAVQVQADHLGLDESRAAQQRADGVDGVARLQDAGAGLEQQGGQQEVVVAADEGEVDALVAAELPLQVPGGVQPGEPAAEHDDPADAGRAGAGARPARR